MAFVLAANSEFADFQKQNKSKAYTVWQIRTNHNAPNSTSRMHCHKIIVLGQVVRNPINTNPELKVDQGFNFS